MLAATSIHNVKDLKSTEIESASHVEHIEDISDPNSSTTTEDLNNLRCLNQTSSPLLRLPRELRDIIISFVVADHSAPHSADHTGLPPLLQVCHQIRPEVAELYYGRKLIMAGGAPSPKYEKHFFDGFDPEHKRYLKRVHWLWDAYGTREQAMQRAGQLDRLTDMRDGVWTVGFIDVFETRSARAVYVNSRGVVKAPGSCC